MASNAYINTISTIAMSKILAEYTWEVYAHRPKNKTMRGICQRIDDDAQAALYPYLNDSGSCQYDIKAQRKVERKLSRVNELFNSRGETLGTWVNFNLAALDDLLQHMQDAKRRAAIERLIYAVKAMSRYIDRDMNAVDEFERAGELTQVWERAA